ncbi:MAG: hypothetical protein ACK4EY_14540, partial [Flavipsychrobacter sp.]
MEAVQILKQDAIKAYNNGDAAFKQRMAELMPTLFGDIKERVKTFEDACAVLGIDADSIVASTDTKDEAAYKKLKVIVRALNEGWKPDYFNTSEAKYYPWFKMNVSGAPLGFSFHDYGYDYATTDVGARLVFKSRE